LRYIFLTVVFITCIFAAGVWSHAGASEFGPFIGRIIDADTKEPIEGVVVLIEWRESHMFAGSTFYDARETLTDKKGDFYIPRIWVFNPLVWLRAEADVIIYKSGYGATDGIEIHGHWESFLEMEWGAPRGTYIFKFDDGIPVIKLKKLTIEERKQSSLSDPTSGDIPREKKKLLLQEIDKDYGFKYPPRK